MDQVESAGDLQHVGLGRPRRLKTHGSTTIILEQGEKVEHKPVNTGDLFAKPMAESNIEDFLSDDKVTENKPARGIPVVGRLLPGLSFEQVKLQSNKPENSRSSGIIPNKLGESLANGKECLFTQVKLKPISPKSPVDKKEPNLFRNTLDEQQISEKGEQDNESEQPGLLKNNPFLRADKEKREKERNLRGLSKVASPQSNNKEDDLQNKCESLVLPCEKQFSNHVNSEATFKASPSSIPEKLSVENPTHLRSDLVSQPGQSRGNEYINVRNPAAKMSLIGNARISTQIPSEESDSLASSLSGEKQTSKVTKNIENPITDFTGKLMNTSILSSSKHGSSHDFQLREDGASNSKKRMAHYLFNEQRCHSLVLQSGCQSPDSLRPLSQMQSSIENKRGSTKVMSKTELSDESENSSHKSSSADSNMLTSSRSTELSKEHPDEDSVNHLYRKSGKPSVKSDSDHSDASSGELKAEEEKPISNIILNKDSVAPSDGIAQNDGLKNPPKRKPKSEKDHRNATMPTSDQAKIEDKGLEGSGKFETEYGASYVKAQHANTRERKFGRRKPRIRRHRSLLAFHRKNSADLSFDQEDGENQKSDSQIDQPSLSKGPIKKPRRKTSERFVKKAQISADQNDESIK